MKGGESKGYADFQWNQNVTISLIVKLINYEKQK